LIPLGCSSHKSRNGPATSTLPKYETTSTITTGRDGDAVFPVVDNGRFYVVSDYGTDQAARELTIQEHIVTDVRTDRECCEARITANGFINDKPVWTLTKKDDEAEMYGRFYRTVRHGCCGSATRDSYFDPLTGRLAFIATESLASIEVVSSSNAYSLDRYVALNRISEPGDDQFVLQIQYGPQSGPSQVAFLTYPGQDAAPSSTKLQLLSHEKLAPGQPNPSDDLTLFPPDYPSQRAASTESISGFSISLTVSGFPPVQIPVVKDRVDFQHLSLPKGFRISDLVPAEDAEYLRQMIQ
jgi:hypothetical protein